MLGWLLLAILVIALVVWLVVSYARSRNAPDDMTTARRILAERFARGELDVEEYNSRLAALR